VTLVLDASVALAWIFDRADVDEVVQANSALAQLRDQTTVVPALWHAEVLNALIVAQRRKVITASKALDFISRLGKLPILTDSAVPSRKEYVMALAHEHELSGYDALYLELAIRTRGALATFDKRLARVRDKAGLKAL
jgi:predicted nucleic acid-binding protein